MSQGEYADYFARLRRISFAGRIYKRRVSSPVLYRCARGFGKRIIEIGCGTGSGVLGAYPDRVLGLEINPIAVDFCKSEGYDARLMGGDGSYPVGNGDFDACILDNVLEHIENPSGTLDECYRITSTYGGLVIAVPGVRGYESDDDHKIFYDADALRELDERWVLQHLFSLPFLFKSEILSNTVRQYCLVATYRKRS